MSDWPSAPAADSQDWTRLNTTILSGAAASVTVSGIDTDYKKFRILFYAIKDATGASYYLRINGDSGGNYSYEKLLADNTTVGGSRTSATTFIELRAGSIGASRTALSFIEIAKPSTSVAGRVTVMSSVLDAVPAITLALFGAEWNNTADSITSLAIHSASGNFAIGTRLLLGGSKDTI